MHAMNIFLIELFNCTERLHVIEYEENGVRLQLSVVQYEALETKNEKPVPKKLFIDPHEAL